MIHKDLDMVTRNLMTPTLLEKLDVFQRLSSSKATLEHQRPLSEGLGMAIWSNKEDNTSYHAPYHHTLSCYIGGGYDTVRVDGSQRKTGGAPGRICLMPAQHQSYWEVGGELRFIHLYFDDAQLQRISESVFDKSFCGSLPDLTFSQDPWIATFCQQLIRPLQRNEQNDSLFLSSAADILLTHLLSNYAGLPSLPTNRGGLSPTIQKRLIAYIHAHPSSPITISDLAEQADLSSYHFARMFKHSFGVSPHQYVTEQRLQRAYQQITKDDLDLQSIALENGFFDQSHFNRRFKQRFQMTPRECRGVAKA